MSKTPDFAKATAVSIEACGFDTIVGWANPWKTDLWVLLPDAEKAYKFLIRKYLPMYFAIFRTYVSRERFIK